MRFDVYTGFKVLWSDMKERVINVQEQYLTVPQAATVLGVSKSAIYEAIREARIRSELVFGRRVIRREEVAAYQQRTEGVGARGGRPKIRRKRGRPRTHPIPVEGVEKRPVGRPRKQAAEGQTR
jgi:excisionase family DNA binding protein